jgi:hypothetical protein
MAALQERNGSFRLIFWFHGKQHTFTIGHVHEHEARDTAATAGNLLRGVEDGRIKVPADLDIVAFLRKRLATFHRETALPHQSGYRGGAGHCLGQLYQAARLYVNHFQPSAKLKSKVRVGGRVKKTYHTPATPCERLQARSSWTNVVWCA